MVQMGNVKAALALLYEIAELERVASCDRAKLDRLRAKLQVLLAEDHDRGRATVFQDAPHAALKTAIFSPQRKPYQRAGDQGRHDQQKRQGVSVHGWFQCRAS
jgi:hypothetical protein